MDWQTILSIAAIVIFVVVMMRGCGGLMGGGCGMGGCGMGGMRRPRSQGPDEPKSGHRANSATKT